ncbi:hypothetical protein [Armatimonas sp.]|uniref:hypothetical protein n=1 Tax=Armatimonas sp. TaxID=1872638 RepID=UPI00286D00C3|nr:hypothetical protein [Armatimonas sp.]
MERNDTPHLRSVRIAAPCHESWNAMPGSERVRSCERCQHKVYNLSELTTSEAEALIRSAEGRLCVRFYRRADGTILTKDCTVGATARRNKRVAQATAGIAAAVGSAAALFRPQPTLGTPLPVIQTTPEPIFHPVMGAIAAPTPVMGNVMGKVARPERGMGEMASSNPTTLDSNH